MEPLRLQGEIDIGNADAILDSVLRKFVCAPHLFRSDTIEFNCSELEFIDSSGLKMLVTIQKRTGRSIVLLSVREPCRRVFELTALDHLFELR